MIEIARNELKVETKNIFVDDVLQFIDKLVKKGEKFDLILFDIY
jgi:23S rRNA G2069 N7-methylase RlmK/C1962 C5-methylase RlmI